MIRQHRLNLMTTANAGLALILVAVPFHAFLAIWLAGFTGHYELLRVWKEILLLVLLPVVAVLLWRRRAYWRELDTRWIFWASVCYLFLNVVLGVLAYAHHQVNLYALSFGLVSNLRYLLMFWLCLIVAAQSAWLRRHWRTIVIWPAAAVIVFGLLQLTVLPIDFLRHFGYGPSTILPYGTVDQKVDYIRLQSFLRGANPLGTYLILVMTALVTGWDIWARRGWKRLARITLVAAGAAVLLFTYSRSAYIGTAVSLGVIGWWAARQYITRTHLVAGIAAIAIAGATVLLIFRDNDRFQNVIFHTDETSRSQESSNQGRMAALQRGAHDVVTEPFGRGTGTAGPASAHNELPARIAENYYLQIGQETGWLGMGLFIAINLLVGVKLWRQRRDLLARVLLASFIGISLVNMLSHAWADDTISLLWWGLAGIAVAPAILPKPAAILTKAHGKSKKDSETVITA